MYETSACDLDRVTETKILQTLSEGPSNLIAFHDQKIILNTHSNLYPQRKQLFSGKILKFRNSMASDTINSVSTQLAILYALYEAFENQIYSQIPLKSR